MLMKIKYMNRVSINMQNGLLDKEGLVLVGTVAIDAAGIAVTRIGSMTAETEVSIEGLDGRAVDLVQSGWDHFGGDANAQSR